MVSKWRKLEVMFEFLLFGIFIGIIEDIVAIKLTTGASITPRMIGIIVLIAIPFAIVGEMVADRVNLARTFKKISDGINHRKNNKTGKYKKIKIKDVDLKKNCCVNSSFLYYLQTSCP